MKSIKRNILIGAIFSHGFGATSYAYTTICEELASQGYIVVALNHTYAADPVEFSDGTILGLADVFKRLQPGSAESDEEMYKELAVWVDDINFVLNELERINSSPGDLLEGRLNLQAVGMVGHSFGGMAAFQLCSLDDRIKAGVNMDGLWYCNFDHQVSVPFMVLHIDHEMLTGQELATLKMKSNDYQQILNHLESCLTRLNPSLKGDAYVIKFINGDHMTFSDYLLAKPSQKQKVIPALRGIEIIRALLVDFLDVHLQDKKSLVLQKLDYPEVEMISMVSPN